MTTNRATTPDEIAHVLATTNADPLRIFLHDGTVTVPTEPCRGGTPPTTTVPANSFLAVNEDTEITDGGLTLFGISGLHLPASEWRRLGFEKNWKAEDADLESPFFPPQRKLEVWASREQNLWETEPEQYSFDHLSSLPEDSPVITVWRDDTPDDTPAKPPVPLDRPSLYVHTVRAEGVTDTRGCDRIEVGAIAAVERVETLDEWPREPDVEPRTVDASPPLRHQPTSRNWSSHWPRRFERWQNTE